MISMIWISFLTGLRLPTGRQTASRSTSAIAWAYLVLWSVPICVHVPASTLYWSTWRQKQDITQSVKEFHTIPHLFCYPHRSHRWQPLAGSSEQLWDQPAPWENFTLPWTTLLKGWYIKVHLHRNYHGDFYGDCLHDCITTWWCFQQLSQILSWSL